MLDDIDDVRIITIRPAFKNWLIYSGIQEEFFSFLSLSRPVLGLTCLKDQFV
ncbi:MULTISPECIES: hypothetical protein [unclassified Methanosarcina]|uniref:hypothetical protein n=1 Tax=unclassified Methanosarcina TaxID=2644672 RepID=UPI000B13E8D3|nr:MULTISPECIES: hypothetical protein [unclassified Methanosarcina]